MKNLLFTVIAFFGLATITFGQTVPSYVPSNGLVGYWPFNGNANDESGNGNNGTVNGATLTSDRFGNGNKAYSYDGVNDFIEVQNNSSLNPTYYTISAWVNPSGFYLNNQDDANYIVGKGNDYNQGNFSLLYKSLNRKAYGAIGVFNFVNSTSSINTGNWYNLISTWDGTTLKIYFNGILENTSVFNSINVGSSNESLFFGTMATNQTWPYWLNGKIDDIGIWNRALTQQEITNLYTAQFIPPVSACEWKSIDAGHQFSLAIKGDNTLWTWGDDTFGQLGRDNSVINSIPGQVSSSLGWSEVTAYYNHAAGIKSDGTLWAWGDNSYGQLGNGSLLATSEPVQIGSQNDWVAVDAGERNTYALKSNGTLWAWGDNSIGQLGTGTSLSSLVPVQVGTSSDWTMIAAGRFHVLALKSNNSLWSWGTGPDGSLGTGSLSNQSIPVQVGSSLNWSKIAAGVWNSAAIKNDGTLWIWGRNDDGELGNGLSGNSITPIQVGNANDWQSISLTYFHPLAIKQNGTLWSWGYNIYGQVGNGALINQLTPVQITNFNDWTIAAGGLAHTSAIRSDGSLWAWGYNTAGQFGNGLVNTGTSSPIQIQDPFQIFTEDSVCACGSAYTLDAGAGFSSYAWSNSSTSQTLNVTSTGWYRCTVAQGSCSVTDSIFVSLVDANIVNNDTTICSGSNLQLSAIGSGAIANAPQLVDQFTMTFGGPFNRNVNTVVGETYSMTVSGQWDSFCEFGGKIDAAYSRSASNSTWGPTNLCGIYSACIVGWNGQSIRPTPDVYNPSHIYTYTNLTATQASQAFTFTDSPYGDNCGSLNFSIYANIPTLSYLWSTGATTSTISLTPTQTTTYYCTVSNGITSCVDSVIVTVNNFNANLFTQDTIAACGTSYTLDAGPGFSSYTWSTSSTSQTLNVTSNGWYRCTVAQGSCSVTDSVFVSLVDAQILNNDTTICNGSAINLYTNNPGAAISSQSYFNDFESCNLNDFTYSGGTIGIANSAFQGSCAVNMTHFAGQQSNNFYPTGLNFGYGTYTVMANATAFISDNIMYLFQGDALGGGLSIACLPNNTDNPGLYLNGLGITYGTTNINVTQGQWYELKVEVFPTIINVYIAGSLRYSTTSFQTPTPGRFKLGVAFSGTYDNMSFVPFNAQSITYLWSTGATTPTISVTPTQTTTYYCTVTNGISSCVDSVTVTVKPTSTSSQTITACDSYQWNDNTYKSSGTYTYTGTNAVGCDSIVTLNLTITPQPAQPSLACYETASFNTSTCSWDVTINGGNSTFYADADGDGFGDASTSIQGYTCLGTPSGYVTSSDDCNDTPGSGASVNTSTKEICGNLIDDNCDGLIDETCPTCVNSPAALAGADQTICGTASVTLAGSLVNSSAGSWSTSGTGTFSPSATAADATYIPSNADRTAGTVTLTWCTADAVAPCVNSCDAINVSFAELIAGPGPITGALILCYPTPGAPYTLSVTPAPGATSYTWSVPAGATIISGQGTTTLTVSFSFVNIHNGILGEVAVQANNTNGCGTSAPSVAMMSVQLVPPVTPGSISGPLKVCPGDAIYTFSVASVARASSYIWTAPVGATILSGQGTQIITASFGAGFVGGNMTVAGSNGCGIGTERIRTLFLNNLPAPAEISGMVNGVCGAVGATYAITAPVAGAVSYQWSVPSNVAITSNTGNSITVDFLTGFTSGNISVAAVNNCGNSPARTITVNGYPAATGAILGSTPACKGTINMYSVASVAGASNYIWFVSNGTALPIQPTINHGIGQGQKNIEIRTNAAGTIAVNATNACGAGRNQNLSVTTVICPRIGDATAGLNLMAYPNPTSDVLNVAFASEKDQHYTLRLLDVMGRIVMSDAKFATEGQNQVVVKVNGLASGIYSLQLQMNGESETIRIFVE